MTAFRKTWMTRGSLKVMIAGHGGQGVLDLGNFIAYQALHEGYHVVYTPTYGPETRGGKVRCWVTVSQGEIDSPVAEIVDVLFILNKPSMDFVPQLRPGGLLLYNTALIDRHVGREDIRVAAVPASVLTTAVDNAGNSGGIDAAKTLNCILYGSFLGLAGLSPGDALADTEKVFRHVYPGTKARFVPLNLAAVKRGYAFMRETHDGGDLVHAPVRPGLPDGRDQG